MPLAKCQILFTKLTRTYLFRGHFVADFPSRINLTIRSKAGFRVLQFWSFCRIPQLLAFFSYRTDERVCRGIDKLYWNTGRWEKGEHGKAKEERRAKRPIRRDRF